MSPKDRAYLKSQNQSLPIIGEWIEVWNHRDKPVFATRRPFVVIVMGDRTQVLNHSGDKICYHNFSRLKQTGGALFDELKQKDAEIERLKESMKIDISDLIMIDDKLRSVTGIVSDPVLRVYYWIGNTEHIAPEADIDGRFVNMDRLKEPTE